MIMIMIVCVPHFTVCCPFTACPLIQICCVIDINVIFTDVIGNILWTLIGIEMWWWSAWLNRVNGNVDIWPQEEEQYQPNALCTMFLLVGIWGLRCQRKTCQSVGFSMDSSLVGMLFSRAVRQIWVLNSCNSKAGAKIFDWMNSLCSRYINLIRSIETYKIISRSRCGFQILKCKLYM